MSPVIAKTLAATGPSLETPGVTAAKTGASRFEEVRARTASQPDQTLTHVTTQQVSPAMNRPLPWNIAQASPAALLTPKLDQISNSLTILGNRVTAVGGSSSPSLLRGRLESLESQFSQVGKHVKAIGPQTDPMQLLKLQHEIYQINEEIEVLSKVVEQASNGVKSVLQTQI